MSGAKTYLWFCGNCRFYKEMYKDFDTQGLYVLCRTKDTPTQQEDIYYNDEFLTGNMALLFNILDISRVISSSTLEDVDVNAPQLRKANLTNPLKISPNLYSIRDEDGSSLPLIQIDIDQTFEKFGMRILQSMQEKKVSTHFEHMEIGTKDLSDTDKKNALQKLLEDSGGKDALKDGVTRKLVLVVDFPKDIKNLGGAAASARVSSRTGTISASRAARIKLAVAADHVNGTPFTASKALIAGESASHPLVAAVMGLRIGASSYAVNRVLDMAPSAHHAVNEVEEAMKMVAAHPHDVVSVYPCGVATRLLDNDTDGAVTEALSRVF